MDTLTSKQIKTHLVGLREGLPVGLRLGRGVGFEVATSKMPDSEPVVSTVAASDDVAGFEVVGVSVTSNMPDSEPVISTVASSDDVAVSFVFPFSDVVGAIGASVVGASPSSS
jgi:hypothetical protein